MNRREFITTAAGALAAAPFIRSNAAQEGRRERLALVGTGSRGLSMWSEPVLKEHGGRVEFVGLCDNNPGRLAYAKKKLKAACPTFADFDRMLAETKPDRVIVTTVDATHHEFIVKALNAGCDVITEKPMTTDENKCQAILDAEKKSGRKVTVAFNYRYGVQMTRIKELLREGRIGDITSVDFHWYLNVHHGADYFRRWHRLREKGGTLLVHKSTHHFDLMNWWLDSEPEQVTALGSLDFYGRNHEFRHTHCRGCPFKDRCRFFWDITKSKSLTELYVDHEKHDGYLRDGCVWKEDVDIFDKMAVQVRYAGNISMSYSLTTYSPFEGWRVAFNGKNGRIESWNSIPWDGQGGAEIDQAAKHEKEYAQDAKKEKEDFDRIVVMENFKKHEIFKVPAVEGGHGGGDAVIRRRVFAEPDAPDPLGHAAGSRAGAMSILTGIAARNSIDAGGKPVHIADLVNLTPARRPA